MRSVCVQTLNRLCRLTLYSNHRLVHSTSTMAEEYVEKLKKDNPYYSKYQDKIAKLREASADEVERRVQQKNQSDRVAKDAEAARSFAGKAPKPTAAAQLPQAKPTTLNDVIKLELIQDKSSEEIGQLWIEYFKTKDSVSAVIPAQNYKDLISNSEKFPTFLLPLPRQEGYEFVMVQFAGNEAHFTALINYQTYKENAPECMTMVHYPELAGSKGIVLMVAEYDNTALNASEAQCLANEVQLYYCRPDERRRLLLEQFTARPDAFKYQDLIQTLEDVQL